MKKLPSSLSVKYSTFLPQRSILSHYRSFSLSPKLQFSCTNAKRKTAATPSCGVQLCISADPVSTAVTKEKIAKAFAANKYPLVVSPTKADLEAIKKSGDEVILVVSGSQACEALEELCDDMNAPTRRVKLIYSITAGVDTYRFQDLKHHLKGIPFCNAQGCFSAILAEHVIFSMLHFNRYPWRLLAQKEQKKWERFSMIRLEGQKVGIIGYGNIGQECGRLAVAMGMKVTGIKRSVNEPVDRYGVHIRGEDYMDQLLQESDFIVGVLPATSHTVGFFNKSVFSKMKPSAVFINIGRGVTQNEDDIVQALQNNVIRGAALDVFQVEPLPPTSPLWQLPDDKVLLTPHCADVTDDIVHISADRFIGIAKEFFETKKVTAYTVDVEKGY